MSGPCRASSDGISPSTSNSILGSASGTTPTSTKATATTSTAEIHEPDAYQRHAGLSADLAAVPRVTVGPSTNVAHGGEEQDSQQKTATSSTTITQSARRDPIAAEAIRLLRSLSLSLSLCTSLSLSSSTCVSLSYFSPPSIHPSLPPTPPLPTCHSLFPTPPLSLYSSSSLLLLYSSSFFFFGPKQQ